MDLDTYHDENDRRFDANIAEIAALSRNILSASTLPDDVTEFYRCFFMFSDRKISESVGFPKWFERFKTLSKSLENPVYANLEVAAIARSIYKLVDDIAYAGAEEWNVQNSGEVLHKLREVRVAKP